jgi:Zn-finger nucleic acid-binding protein
VWLDRGELDKLTALEGDVPDTSTPPRSRLDEYRGGDERNRRHDHCRRYDEYHGGYQG